MRNALAILIGLISAPVALAQPAPTLKTVSAIDKEKGTITFNEVMTRAVPVTKFVPKIQNGVTVIEAVTVYEYQSVSYQTLLSIANSRVITPDGKQLPIDEVWKRVKANTVLAVSATSTTPAEVFRRALNSDTLIIIPVPHPMEVPQPVPQKKK